MNVPQKFSSAVYVETPFRPLNACVFDLVEICQMLSVMTVLAVNNPNQ
jgi:hypothetical protein